LLPKIHILATGGTIGFGGLDRLDGVRYSELGGPIYINDLIARVPELAGIARVSAEQIFVEGFEGQSIGPQEWLAWACRCNELFHGEDPPDGIVITHGTYVMEETAYFLNLTVKSDRPVVLTGAQRPSTTMSSDADLNLFNAVLTAGASDSENKGVLVVLNHQINAAREVTKSNTYRMETFQSRDLGFLGYVDSDGQVIYYRSVVRRHTSNSEFDVTNLNEFPLVDIVMNYAGADGRVVDALVEKGTSGLIIAGMGGRTLQPSLVKAVKNGIIVVRASNLGSGRVIDTPGTKAQGIIAADNLLPKKARILLMLALTITRDPEQIQKMFKTY
jgi:L-asparaginase type II